jgi:hypothetical protein
MKMLRWGKWLGKAFLAFGIGLPLVVIGTSNLFLISPKGRTYVASLIQRKTQLETTVQSCTWSPWNGFTIHGLLVEQPVPLRKAIPKPLLTAQSIRIHPDWRALLGRKILIRGIEIVKPALSVPIELMSQISEQPAADVSTLAASELPQIALALAANGNPNLPSSTAPKTDAEDGVAKKNPPAKAKSVTELRTPTVSLTFTDAQFDIVSAMMGKTLYRISRINGGLPIGGEAANSEFVMSGYRILGNRIPGRVKLPVKWQAPVLSFTVTDGAMSGIHFRAEARIALRPGIPFVVGVVLPKQDDLEIAPSDAVSARIGSLAGQGQITGHFLAPSSWKGQGIVQAKSLDAVFGEQTAHFEQGQAIVIFQNGALRCMDARLMGEAVTLMGNGAILTDGRAAGNARIVAAPETLAAISKFTQPASSALQLTPLSTAQRAALDLQVFGRPGTFYYKPNPAAEPLPLK